MINGNFFFPKQPIAYKPRLKGMKIDKGYHPTTMKKIVTITTLFLFFVGISFGPAFAGPTHIDAKAEKKTSLIRHKALTQGSSLTTQFEAAQAAQASITVQNASGKIVLEKEVQLKAGTNRLKLRLSDLPEGHYLIKVASPDQTELHSVVLH